MSKKISKTFADHVAPYDASAPVRANEYDALDTATLYKPLLPVMAPAPARILDVGAGSGRDAAWFAARGYDVVAIEPSPELRKFIAEKAAAVNGKLDVRDGMLPQLSSLGDGEKFDLIMLGGVWQHVLPGSRKDAFNRMAAHLKPGGILFITLREGPVPQGRKMYRVTAKATTRMAKENGLQPLALDSGEAKDLLGRGGVRWTSFAARKPK